MSIPLLATMTQGHKDLVNLLKLRSMMFSKVRSFFSERGLLEVDCPAICNFAPIDLHIDIMRVDNQKFLFSSPEYGMKRLLSLGAPDIYQLSHVYRKEEVTNRHNPEFMLVEWYRKDSNYDDFLEECAQFIKLFVPEALVYKISYKEAFIKHAEINPFACSDAQLKERCKPFNPPADWNRDDLLNLLLSRVVEPGFNPNILTILTGYPKSQAMLARTEIDADGTEVAKRFEFFLSGLELGNGYHELTDPKEQKRRLEETGALRQSEAKDQLPIDQLFLEALERGLPDCFGVAMGIDRLLMVQTKSKNIHDILPFNWNNS